MELGVQAVVEGTFLRSGEKARISVQLIETSSDTHLWAESYERDPTVTLTYIAMGTAYEQKQMYPDAISAYEKGIEIGGAVALSKAFLGHVYGSAGNRDKAREILHELESMSLRGYVPALDRAIVYDGLKETEAGIQALEESFRDRDTLLIYIKVWPHFDNLRLDPRFAGMQRQLGL